MTRMIFKEKTKAVPISKEMVWQAYKKVKRNRGSAGVDKVDFIKFDSNLSRNLYKIWNRMSSGSYFPPLLKRVSIPKANGKRRNLGIPTIGDRIAQEVVKNYLEPRMEGLFSPYSYGYRPNKSAHQAIAEVQKNVRTHAWAIDLDIEAFFDEVDHELLLKALRKHVKEKWVLLYIKRWLTTPILLTNGELEEKQGKGTPQGGVISPLLANLYLHYVLDKWLDIYHPHVKYARYADDIILHCKSKREVQALLASVRSRLSVCKLKAHPKKTKIVYCKNYRNKGDYKQVSFDFLGFTFKPQDIFLRKDNKHFLGYDCVMSRTSKKRINEQLKQLYIHRKTGHTIQELAKILNPKIRGWVQYYGKVSKRSLHTVFYYIHQRLIKWVLNKYKRFKRSRVKAVNWLKRVTESYPSLFYHWHLGYLLV